MSDPRLRNGDPDRAAREVAREAARRADGRFGPHARAEAVLSAGGVDLSPAGSRASAPADSPQGCLAIAREAHAGQFYDGKPYVEAHVLPVSRLLAPYGQRAEMVGLLHDVVEDSDVTLDDLRADGIGEDVLEAVEAMTKRPGESKAHAGLRARDTCRLSRLGKLADNTCNRLNLPALAATDPKRADRLAVRYAEVREILLTDPDGSRNTEFEQIAADMEAAWRRPGGDRAGAPGL